MSGKKPLGCLILHGFSGSLDTVRPIAAVCEELHLPYRMPVLRGHSSKPEDLLQVEHDHWIEDAKAAALELVGAEVDELSMGGLVALQLAVDPELKVRELILLAPALKFADFRLEFVASKSSSNTRRTMVSAVNMFGAYKPGPDGFEDLERKKACTKYVCGVFAHGR
jgi:esterase/lipase